MADMTLIDALRAALPYVYKCGKVDRADCGLHLPGAFDRNTMRERRWRAKLDKATGGVKTCRYTSESGGACWRQGKAVELCTCHAMTDEAFRASARAHAADGVPGRVKGPTE
jgi:hypothetical protein